MEEKMNFSNRNLLQTYLLEGIWRASEAQEER